MKKSITITFCFVAAMLLQSIFAFSFKGIEIEGPIKIVEAKLIAKDLVVKEETDDEINLVGEFAGENVAIVLEKDKNSGNIAGMMIVDVDKNAYRTYNLFRDLYVEKYGQPSLTEDTMRQLLAEDGEDLSARVHAVMFIVAGGNLMIAQMNEIANGKQGVIIKFEPDNQ